MILDVTEAIAHLTEARASMAGCCNMNYYICSALRRSAGAPSDARATGNDTVDGLLKYIETELGKTGNACLDSHVSVLMACAGVSQDLRTQVLQDYIEPHGTINPWQIWMRTAWIDRMIHQLNEDGTLP